MNEKRMKVILFKDKLSGLKSIDLNFCEDREESVSQRPKKTLKAKN